MGSSITIPMYPFRTFTKEEMKNIMECKFQVQIEPILYKLFLTKLYDKVSRYIPASVMPNQITWLGFLAMILSTVSTLYFNMSLDKKNKILSFFNFVFLFIYFSADFVDGIHARATKQTSNLGALLDHGIDSLNTVGVILALNSSLQGRLNDTFIFFTGFVLNGFYLSGIFMKYNGFLKLNYISAISEGLVSIMVIHLLSSFTTVLDTVKARFKNGNLKSHCVLINILVFLYSTGEILYYFDGTSFDAFSLLISYLYFAILFSFLFCFVLSNAKHSKTKFYIFLFIFSNCFTLCYVEETISHFTKSSTDFRLFLSCYLFLGCFFLFEHIFKSILSIYIVLIFSLLHFLFRIGSILNNLSKGLNAKIFTRAF